MITRADNNQISQQLVRLKQWYIVSPVFFITSIVPYEDAAQANQDRHVSPPANFLLKESLLYTYIPLTECVGQDQPARRYITQSP